MLCDNYQKNYERFDNYLVFKKYLINNTKKIYTHTFVNKISIKFNLALNFLLIRKKEKPYIHRNP